MKPTPRTPRHRRRITGHRAVTSALVAGVLLAGGLVACTPEDRENIAEEVEGALEDVEEEVPTDLPDAELPGDTETGDQATAEPTEPATVEPTTPAPSPEAAQTAPPTDEEEGINWWPWIIAALVALALLAAVVAAVRRRRRERELAQARLAEALGDIVGTGRWVHDQGSTEAMRLSDPVRLDRSWRSTRQQLVQLEERVSRLLVDTEDEPLEDALRTTAEASAGLRSALDADVAGRLDPEAEADPALEESTRDTVHERRTHFRDAIERLATFR